MPSQNPQDETKIDATSEVELCCGARLQNILLHAVVHSAISFTLHMGGHNTMLHSPLRYLDAVNLCLV